MNSMSQNIEIPSYIHRFKLNFSKRDQLISDILKDYSVCKNIEDLDFTERTTSFMRLFFGGSMPDYSGMDIVNEFMDSMFDAFEEYVKHYKLNVGSFNCFRIWYAIYEKGDQSFAHHHISTGNFSGVYFLKFNKEKHNPTFFSNLPPAPELINPLAICPELEEGDLVFFPSSINHGSFPNESDEVRICLAFDIVSSNVSKEMHKKVPDKFSFLQNV